MRTNKYFANGTFTHKTFAISEPKSTKHFSMGVTINDILDDTPVEAILETVKLIVANELTESIKSKIAMKEVNLLNVSLIDSFEQPVTSKMFAIQPEPAKA